MPNVFGDFGLIVDLGTTNISLRLINLKNGRARETVFVENPQKKHGRDIISRLTFFSLNPGKNLAVMQKLAWQGVVNVFKKLPKKFLPGNVRKILVVGNSVMLHFLAGKSPKKLLSAPFDAGNFKKFTLASAAKIGGGYFKNAAVIFPPIIKGFIGADFLADLYFLADYQKPFFLLDLGTNAEVALVTDKKIFLTSAAAGPAFDGYDSDKTIYGSELIKTAVYLRRKKQMSSSGLILEKSKSKFQKNIRNLQTAKAAVRAAGEILLSRAGLNGAAIRAFYLTGFFGSKIPAADLKTIGLLPAAVKASKTRFLPNLPLAGGTGILKNLTAARQAIGQKIFSRLKYYNLADEAEFNDLFLKYLEFERRKND